MIGVDPVHWRWRDGPVAPGPAVVFDMDGVLSDAAGRQHLLERPRRDWDAFFEAVGEDQLIDEVARLLEVLDPDLRIVLLTARPIRVQAQTLAWLGRPRAAVGPARHAGLGRLRLRPGVQAGRGARPPRLTASTSASPSRTTGATSTCSTARACRASTSTPATTTERGRRGQDSGAAGQKNRDDVRATAVEPSSPSWRRRWPAPSRWAPALRAQVPPLLPTTTHDGAAGVDHVDGRALGGRLLRRRERGAGRRRGRQGRRRGRSGRRHRRAARGPADHRLGAAHRSERQRRARSRRSTRSRTSASPRSEALRVGLGRFPIAGPRALQPRLAVPALRPGLPVPPRHRRVRRLRHARARARRRRGPERQRRARRAHGQGRDARRHVLLPGPPLRSRRRLRRRHGGAHRRHRRLRRRLRQRARRRPPPAHRHLPARRPAGRPQAVLDQFIAEAAGPGAGDRRRLRAVAPVGRRRRAGRPEERRRLRPMLATELLRRPVGRHGGVAGGAALPRRYQPGQRGRGCWSTWRWRTSSPASTGPLAPGPRAPPDVGRSAP